MINRNHFGWAVLALMLDVLVPFNSFAAATGSETLDLTNQG